MRQGGNRRGPGWKNSPGNSVSDTGDRINGGAVMDERSPEKDAMLRNIVRNMSEPQGIGWAQRFQERCPATALGDGNGLQRINQRQ